MSCSRLPFRIGLRTPMFDRHPSRLEQADRSCYEPSPRIVSGSHFSFSLLLAATILMANLLVNPFTVFAIHIMCRQCCGGLNTDCCRINDPARVPGRCSPWLWTYWKHDLDPNLHNDRVLSVPLRTRRRPLRCCMHSRASLPMLVVCDPQQRHAILIIVILLSYRHRTKALAWQTRMWARTESQDYKHRGSKSDLFQRRLDAGRMRCLKWIRVICRRIWPLTPWERTGRHDGE